MIEDRTLLELFKSESEEHFQCLDDGLLRLEKAPRDTALVEEMFREAHSLKGAARMLGIAGLEALAHGFEEILGAAKRGEAALDAGSIERLVRGLVKMRLVAREAISDEPSGVNVSEALAELISPAPPSARNGGAAAAAEASKEEQPAARAAQAPKPLPEETATPGEPPADSPAPPRKVEKPAATAAGSDYRIETVRVETGKLDVLLTQVGELSVTKGRVARHVSDIDVLVDLADEWKRQRISRRHRGPASAAQAGAGEVEEEWLDLLHDYLTRLRAALFEDSARLGFVSDVLVSGVHEIRLLPLATIFTLFPRVVHDLAKEQGKQVELLIEGGEVSADKRILEEMKDPLMHLLRNAIDHGVESAEERQKAGKPAVAKVWLRACQTATNIVIEIADDGRGLDIDAIKRAAVKRHLASEAELAALPAEQIQSLVLISGFSTNDFVTDVSGRGIGLDVVRTNIERLKGTIKLESAPGKGLTVRIQLPITLATTRVLIAKMDGRLFALPTEQVGSAHFVPREQIFTIEGRETIALGGAVLPVFLLSELLGLAVEPEKRQERGEGGAKKVPCIVLCAGEQEIGLLVDELIEEQEVVLRAQSGMLKRVPNVTGATILETGEVCPVLNGQDLIKSARKHQAHASRPSPAGPPAAKKIVLLVEDSITTRTLEKRILEDAGYEVATAVDGLDALDKLGMRAFDAIVSDISMPNLDGIALTVKVRLDKRHQELPIILVTALASDEDKRRGVEAGANAYITKPAFDQKILLDCLARLV